MTPKRSIAAQCVTLTFMIWVFGFLLYPPLPRTPWMALRQFADVSLTRADEASRERFERTLAGVCPPPRSSEPYRARPVAFQALEQHRAKRYLLICEESRPSPGGSTLEMVLMDPTGAVLSRTFWYMGGRTSFEEAGVRIYPGTETSVLAVQTGGLGQAHTQYYGVVDDRMVFLFTTSLALPWHGYGLENQHAVPCGWSDRQWDLWSRTRDPIRVHAGLAWLSGRHAGLCIFHSGVPARPEIRARVRDLAASPDEHLRQAALLAARR